MAGGGLPAPQARGSSGFLDTREQGPSHDILASAPAVHHRGVVRLFPTPRVAPSSPLQVSNSASKRGHRKLPIGSSHWWDQDSRQIHFHAPQVWARTEPSLSSPLARRRTQTMKTTTAPSPAQTLGLYKALSCRKTWGWGSLPDCRIGEADGADTSAPHQASQHDWTGQRV